jgi:hypothetical protein
LPVDHKVGPIFVILGKNIANCKDIEEDWLKLEIQNGRQG